LELSTLLAALALAAVTASGLLALAVDFRPAAVLRRQVIRLEAVAGFLVAGTATAGSLYFSEVKGFVPCELCWFQRIFMYPLALLFLVAAVTRARLPSRYVVPLAGIGLLFSVYHYQLQLFPEQETICTGVVPCIVKYVEEFGFVTIPFMAASGFAALLLLQLAAWRARQLEASDGEDSVPID